MKTRTIGRVLVSLGGGTALAAMFWALGAVQAFSEFANSLVTRLTGEAVNAQSPLAMFATVALAFALAVYQTIR